MKLHVVGLPYSETTREYEWCAFTTRARRFATAMTGLGYEVTLYAGRNNEANAECVQCTDEELPENGFIPEFKFDNPLFVRFNERVIGALNSRVQERDIICLIGGAAQHVIAAAFPNHLVCEFGIGYGGIICLPNVHHVFDSYAWMHTVYGSLSCGDAHAIDGRHFDAVIPNLYDLESFPMGNGDGGYLAFVGRLIDRKGIGLACDIAKITGLPLKVAGFGSQLPTWLNYPRTTDGFALSSVAPRLARARDQALAARGEYVGRVDPEQRAKLMGGALALLVPTQYIEPFGGVAAEAQLCGTPVITTDFGAFTETVQQGVTGFRCRTMHEFVDAVSKVDRLDRYRIHKMAIRRWSLDVVAAQYDTYLRRLQTLWEGGFYDYPLSEGGEVPLVV